MHFTGSLGKAEDGHQSQPILVSLCVCLVFTWHFFWCCTSAGVVKCVCSVWSFRINLRVVWQSQNDVELFIFQNFRRTWKTNSQSYFTVKLQLYIHFNVNPMGICTFYTGWLVPTPPTHETTNAQHTACSSSTKMLDQSFPWCSTVLVSKMVDQYREMKQEQHRLPAPPPPPRSTTGVGDFQRAEAGSRGRRRKVSSGLPDRICSWSVLRCAKGRWCFWCHVCSGGASPPCVRVPCGWSTSGHGWRPALGFWWWRST